MLTVPQAAQLLGVSTSTVRMWIKRGKIARNEVGLIENYTLVCWMDQRHEGKATRRASVDA